MNTTTDIAVSVAPVSTEEVSWAKGPKPAYPFRSKKAIKTQLDTDFNFRCAVMVLLFQWQTAHEQATSSTLNRNRAGFMSSHAVWGSRVARKLLSGADLNAEDIEKIDTIAPRYSRQVSVHEREMALAANPELAKIAALYGV